MVSNSILVKKGAVDCRSRSSLTHSLSIQYSIQETPNPTTPIKSQTYEGGHCFRFLGVAKSEVSGFGTLDECRDHVQQVRRAAQGFELDVRSNLGGGTVTRV